MHVIVIRQIAFVISCSFSFELWIVNLVGHFVFSFSFFFVYYYISQLSFLFKFRTKIIFRSRSWNALIIVKVILMSEPSV